MAGSIWAPLPDEHVIAEAYKALFVVKERRHPLDEYKTDIKTWRDDGESFVVIRYKLNERLGGDMIKDTALRDYVRRNFPSLPKLVMRREAEWGVAELDLGS